MISLFDISIGKDSPSLSKNLKWEQIYGFHISPTLYKNYFLVIKFEDREDFGDEASGGTKASVLAASIKAIGKRRMDKIIADFGMNGKKLSNIEKLTLALDNGSFATLWSQTFNDGEDDGTRLSEEKMLEETKIMAERINILFGFYMDKKQNAMGATGWDFIKGECMPLAMRRSINASRAFHRGVEKKQFEEIKNKIGLTFQDCRCRVSYSQTNNQTGERLP